MLNIRQSLKFSFFLVFAFLLISIQKVNAAALACNANEIAQTFTFGGGNAWTGGSSTNNYTVGTAPNAVTLTFTNTQISTPISGDPSLRQSGNNANALVISGTNSPVGATLSTLALSTNRTINKLTYNVYDMDFSASGASNFRDRIVATRNGGGFPTAMTAVTPANETITLASGNASATNSANCAATDTGCNIEIQFNTTGITSASTQFLADHASDTTAQQSIGFGEYSWCLPRHPTVTISKVSNGSTGSFTFTNTHLASGTTNLTTATAGVPVSSAAINVASLSSNVQIQEPVPSGWQLSSASCTDANGTLTTNGTGTFGSLAGNTLTIPTANLVYGADIRCTFTNTKRPTLRVTKISQGGTGTFTFTGDNGWASQGITTAAAGGSGTAGALQTLTTSSTATTITEALAAGYTMTDVSCSGMGAGGTVTPNLSAGTFTLDAAATAAGSNIACTVTNAKTPTVKIQKTTTGGFGGPFSFAQTNLASTPTSITTTVASTATPTTPTAINVTTIGTAVTLTETPAAGFLISTATCTDANSAITGNTGSAFATLSGNVLTIPALNVKAGADFTCVFTNARRPTITLTKISNGGVGNFSFTGSNGFANQTIPTVSSGVSAVGATQTLTNAATITTITETLPAGYVLMNMSCAGLGGGGAAATFNYATATVTLNAAATAAANNVTCTFTNTSNGTQSVDSAIKTTQFSAASNVPTIAQGTSGTQTITLTNNGPDTATGVVAYFRPILASGVTVTSVTAPSGACSFSSPDWVCPAIGSVSNGGSFNLSVVYSTTLGASLGTAQQGEIRVNSNEYTACGGVNEYNYSVWGAGGNTQANPAPTNSAFWVGNTAATQTDVPTGSFDEGNPLVASWPVSQANPTGTYLYSPVRGRRGNVYYPSSSFSAPTVDKIITNLAAAAENTVTLNYISDLTQAVDNRRAWQAKACVYLPVATSVTPCSNNVDDGAYLAVDGTVIASQNGYTGSLLQSTQALSAGYHLITARIVNRAAQQ
jgi:hypothetical protein